jgi:anti-sigma factor RsiW
MSDHARYEVLLMKAVDGVIAADERAALDEHVASCASCRDELADFRSIKETTDTMKQRIALAAELSPAREIGARRALVSSSFALLLLATVVLVGFAGYTFAFDAHVRIIVKLGAALAAIGALGLLVHTLHARSRGRDPYQEIDQ